MPPLPDSVRRLAERQGGVVTATQMSAIGLSALAIATFVRDRELVRVRRNAYIDGRLWFSATPERRWMLRTRAVLLTRPGSRVSHQCALGIHGLPVYGADHGSVDLVADIQHRHTKSGVRTHPLRALPDEAQREVVVAGLRAVPVATAVAQVLVRDGLEAALISLDAALHTGVVDLAEVAQLIQGLARTNLADREGGRLIALADPRCESPGESRTRLILDEAGLPWRSQVAVHDRQGLFLGRVDFLVGERVIVEFDGAVKYAGAEGREALIAEKRREDRLRALGYAVVRLTWDDLRHPEVVIQRITQAMRDAA